MGGRWVKVACVEIGASEDFQFVTKAIAIGIVYAVACTIKIKFRVDTVPTVISGFFIVVASFDIRATRDFQFITHTIAVDVVEAVAIAIVREVVIDA